MKDAYREIWTIVLRRALDNQKLLCRGYEERYFKQGFLPQTHLLEIIKRAWAMADVQLLCKERSGKALLCETFI